MTPVSIIPEDLTGFQIKVPKWVPIPAIKRFAGAFNVFMFLASHPELIVTLKGAPLTVLIALGMRADTTDGTCYPSIATICEDTGYAKNTVDTALGKLEAAGLVTRTQRRNASTIYRLALYDRGSEIEPPDDEGSKIDPPALSGGSKIDLPKDSGGQKLTPLEAPTGQKLSLGGQKLTGGGQKLTTNM